VAIDEAFDGDEVVVGPGTYDLTGGAGLSVDTAIDLHGAAGQPRPLILTGAGVPLTGVSVEDAATVRDLEIHHTGGGIGLALEPFTGRAVGDRLVVKAQGSACLVEEADIRSSVCQATHNTSGADGLVMLGTDASEDYSATATNVTVLGATTLGAGEYGIHVSSAGGADQLLLGKNLIAAGGDSDIRVETEGSTSSAAVFLIHSTFSKATAAGGPGTEAPPSVAAEGNQTAGPLLADPFPTPDPFLSDLHQLPGSPTVDAGLLGPDSGAADIDGEPRCLGSAPDIGADELTGTPCPTASGPPSPELVDLPTCRGREATIVVVPGKKTKGTAASDVIVGSGERDVIRARGGHDVICGRRGNDLIWGGAGRDTILGQGGRDILRGQGGADLLMGGPGLDRLIGGPGRDRLRSRSDARRQ
jgi:hypothetical protein